MEKYIVIKGGNVEKLENEENENYNTDLLRKVTDKEVKIVSIDRAVLL